MEVQVERSGMKRIKFFVPGTPIGKGRPRITKYGTYTPKKTRDYEQKIRECWMIQSGVRLPDDCMIKLTVRAYFPIPKSYPKKIRESLPGKPHGKLPDLDNCVKAVCDGCQGYAFGNDSHVFCIEAVKLYSEEPRMEIIAEAVKNEEIS